MYVSSNRLRFLAPGLKTKEQLIEFAQTLQEGSQVLAFYQYEWKQVQIISVRESNILVKNATNGIDYLLSIKSGEGFEVKILPLNSVKSIP